jgi:MAD (mothers against decapentaplegic) family protein 1
VKEKLGALCITSVQYEKFIHAANLSRQLSLYLAGNWSKGFDETLEALRVAVLKINSMRVDLSLTEGLSSWISSAFSYFKE